MLLLIITFCGILMFVLGLHLLIKNYKDGKYIKKYGLLTYAGLIIVLLGMISLNEHVITSLLGDLSRTLPLVIIISICMIASKLLLEPTFLKDKVEKGTSMKKCIQCNNSFSFYDRLKSIINGNLKCSHCNAIYKSKPNVDRGIYYSIIFIAVIIVFNHIVILGDFMLQIKLQILTIIIAYPLFDLIPNRWQRYEKIN